MHRDESPAGPSSYSPRNETAAAEDIGSGRLAIRGDFAPVRSFYRLTADAFLANDPVAMNSVLHLLHIAMVMVTMMHRSRLGRCADGND